MREDMRIKTVLTAGFGLMMMGAVPAMAQNVTVTATELTLTTVSVTVSTPNTTVPTVAAGTKIYPHHGENFCPAGYQPVTISGVICCGVPNQNMSYQQAKMTPAPRVHKVKRKVYRQPDCEVGTKGCTYD
jgi:hypothetical protein